MTQTDDGPKSMLDALSSAAQKARENQLIEAAKKDIRETAPDEVKTIAAARADYVRRVRQMEARYGAPKGRLFAGEPTPDGGTEYKYLRTPEARKDLADLMSCMKRQFEIGVEELKARAQPIVERRKISSAPEDRACNAPSLYNRLFNSLLLDLHKLAESVVDAEEAAEKARPGNSAALPATTRPTTQKSR